jgi:hypothetical protein
MLPTASDPLAYNTAGKQFTILSTDGDLIGETKNYGIVAEWATYSPDDFANVSSA